MSVDSQNSEKIRSTGMSDENLVDEHVRLSEVKHEPTKGFLQAPLIFVLIHSIGLYSAIGTCFIAAA